VVTATGTCESKGCTRPAIVKMTALYDTPWEWQNYQSARVCGRCGAEWMDCMTIDGGVCVSREALVTP
jgi:hypothetical protein